MSTAEIQHTVQPGPLESATAQQKLEEFLIFKCFNSACELEFPVFAKDSSHIVYCPRCSGMVVKKVGILKIAFSPADRPIS